MWRDNPPFTLRELLNYIHGLPQDSNTVKYITDSAFDTKEHLLASLVDLVALNVHESSVAAAAMAGKEYRKVVNKRPKAMSRPTMRPRVKEPPKFIKASQLKKMLEKRKVTIHHTKECMDSRINEGGQKLNCACPRG